MISPGRHQIGMVAAIRLELVAAIIGIAICNRKVPKMPPLHKSERLAWRRVGLNRLRIRGRHLGQPNCIGIKPRSDHTQSKIAFAKNGDELPVFNHEDCADRAIGHDFHGRPDGGIRSS